MTSGVVYNHIGLCVTDLVRSRRFYEELLEFTFERELQPPDEGTASLLRVASPVGLTAVYLLRDGLVLELHFTSQFTAVRGDPVRLQQVMGNLISNAIKFTDVGRIELWIDARRSEAGKCVRCWHYRKDIGVHPEHPEICGRCVDNLPGGPGENRQFF